MHALRLLSWQLLLTFFAGLSAEEFGSGDRSPEHPGFSGSSSGYPGSSSRYPRSSSPIDDRNGVLGNFFPTNQIPAFMRVLPEAFLKGACLTKSRRTFPIPDFNSSQEFGENLKKCIDDSRNGNLNNLTNEEFKMSAFIQALLPQSWTKDLPTAEVCVNTQKLSKCILPQSFGKQGASGCNFDAGLKQLLKELRGVPCTNGGGGESITNFGRNAFVGLQCLYIALHDSDFETCLDITKFNVAEKDTACSFLKKVGSCAQKSFSCPVDGKQAVLAIVNVFQELVCTDSTAVASNEFPSDQDNEEKESQEKVKCKRRKAKATKSAAVVGQTPPLPFKLILLPLVGILSSL